MAKYINDGVMDAALDTVAGGNAMHVCAGQPVDRADAISKSLATVPLTGGDFTKANGDVSGRKVTVPQKSAISITSSGTADHVAIINGTILLLATTCTNQALTSGGTVTVPAFDQESADPT